MGRRYLWSLVSISFIVVTACQNTDPHGKISTSNRSGNTPADPKMAKLLSSDGCLDMKALSNMLVEGKTEVSRVLTTDIDFLTGSGDLEKAASVNDATLVARWLNESATEKLTAAVNVPMSQIPERFEILNVLAQDGCKSITVQDTAKNIKRYNLDQPQQLVRAITAPAGTPTPRSSVNGPNQKEIQGRTIEKRPAARRSAALRLVARSEKGDSVILLDVRNNGRILITEVKNLGVTAKVCGVASPSVLRTTTEIAFRGAIDSQPAISMTIAQVIKDHTEASITFNEQFDRITKGQAPIGRERQNFGQRMKISLPVLVDAFSRAQKGQFKNLTCGSGSNPTPAGNVIKSEAKS